LQRLNFNREKPLLLSQIFDRVVIELALIEVLGHVVATAAATLEDTASLLLDQVTPIHLFLSHHTALQPHERVLDLILIPLILVSAADPPPLWVLLLNFNFRCVTALNTELA